MLSLFHSALAGVATLSWRILAEAPELWHVRQCDGMNGPDSGLAGIVRLLANGPASRSIQGPIFHLTFSLLQLFRVALDPASGDRFGGLDRRFRFLGLPHVASHEYLCPLAGGIQPRSG